jgi:hypothetical protein
VWARGVLGVWARRCVQAEAAGCGRPACLSRPSRRPLRAFVQEEPIEPELRRGGLRSSSAAASRSGGGALSRARPRVRRPPAAPWPVPVASAAAARAGLQNGTAAGGGDEATATACGQHAGAIGRGGCLWTSRARLRHIIAAARRPGWAAWRPPECCGAE